MPGSLVAEAATATAATGVPPVAATARLRPATALSLRGRCLASPSIVAIAVVKVVLLKAKRAAEQNRQRTG